MRAIAAGVTDVGRERDHNEDRFVLLPEFAVYVVADGMGGHQCGEVASRMATATIAGYFRGQAEDSQRVGGSRGDMLRDALLAANDRIHDRAANSSLHRGMGTTVVAAAFHRREKVIYLAHAGDSRCYCLRDGELSQLTRDHSLVEEALRTRPDITPSELAYLPANVITRALGVEAAVDVEVGSADVELGDLYLLCSDGLHGFVSDERIAEILREGANLTTLCAELVAEANRNGGGDNITAVVVRIEERAEPWSAPASGPLSSRHGARGPNSAPLSAAGAAGGPSSSAELSGGPNSSGQPQVPSEPIPDTEPAADAAEEPVDPDATINVTGRQNQVPAVLEESPRRRRRRRRRRRDPVVDKSPSSERSPNSRAQLEVDDTARVEAVTDADAILAGDSSDN